MVLAEIPMGAETHAWVPSPQALLWRFSLQTPNTRAWSTSKPTQKSTLPLREGDTSKTSK